MRIEMPVPQDNRTDPVQAFCAGRLRIERTICLNKFLASTRETVVGLSEHLISHRLQIISIFGPIDSIS